MHNDQSLPIFIDFAGPTDSTYFNSLAQCLAYLQRSAAPIPNANAASIVVNDYENIVNWAPDATGLAFWVNIYNSSGNDSSLRSALAHSGDAAIALKNLYAAISNSILDTAGTAYWQGQLAGTVTLANVRMVLASSPAAQAALVSLYRQIVNSGLDSGGATYWTGRLGTDATLADLRVTLAYSSGAGILLGNMFTNILNRPIQTVDLAFWQQVLATTHVLSEIATALAYSPAAQAALNTSFENILYRAIDAGNLAATQAGMANGTDTQASFRYYLAHTPEAQAYLNISFENILNRSIDAGNLAAAQAGMADGTETQASFRTYLAYVPEAQADLNTSFENILGRPIDAGSLTATQVGMANGTDTQAGFRSYLAHTPEAAADILARYLSQTGLQLATSNPEFIAAVSILANGGTQALVASYFSTLPETVAAISSQWLADTGAPIDALNLAGWESIFASGSGLAYLDHQLSTYPPVVNIISSTFQALSGTTIDQASLGAAELSLASGGNVAAAVTGLLNSPIIQTDLILGYAQVVGSPPNSQQIAQETSVLSLAVDAVTNITWSNVSGTIENATLSFLNAINPISQAEAKTPTTPAKQAANLLVAKGLLANPNVLAFLHTISAAELYGVYSQNNYSMLTGDKFNQPTAATNNFAYFPTNAHGAASASGAYQTIQSTWTLAAEQLGIKDFSPASQDAVAAWLLYGAKGTGALLNHPIPTESDFEVATLAAAHRQWAAVPGGPQSLLPKDESVIGHKTGQHAMPYQDFETLYVHLGGALAK